MKKLILIASLFLGFEASGAYVKIAECSGRTDHGNMARAVVFVNKVNDTMGFIAVNIPGQRDVGSETRVSWNSNPQGYPRFYDNDFDLDIVINDKTFSYDDVLLGNEYVARLECVYDPTK